MAVVDKYAGSRPGQSVTGSPGQGGQQPTTSRAARAQPVQRGTPAAQMDAKQLQTALNAAAAAGDFVEMERLGKLIDKLIT